MTLQLFPLRGGVYFLTHWIWIGFMNFFGGRDDGWFLNRCLRILQLYSYSLETWYHHVKNPRLACLMLKTDGKEPNLAIFRMKEITLALYTRPLHELASVMILLSYGNVHILVRHIFFYVCIFAHIFLSAILFWKPKISSIIIPPLVSLHWIPTFLIWVNAPSLWSHSTYFFFCLGTY